MAEVRKRGWKISWVDMQNETLHDCLFL